MPDVFDHELVVCEDDIDEFGHANNLRVLGWTLDAAAAHSDAQGWPAERYRERGVAWVVRSHRIRYLRPALLGERVVVRTWVADKRRAASLRRYRIERGDEVLARVETDWAFVSLQGRVRPIDEDIAAAFILVPDGPEGEKQE